MCKGHLGKYSTRIGQCWSGMYPVSTLVRSLRSLFWRGQCQTTHTSVLRLENWAEHRSKGDPEFLAREYGYSVLKTSLRALTGKQVAGKGRSLWCGMFLWHGKEQTQTAGVHRH